MLTKLRVVATLAGALIALGIGTDVATAATRLYVSTSGNDSSNTCTSPSAPCRTIDHAVAESEKMPGTAAISVGAGTYQEQVPLAKPADDGIAIEGAGTGAGGTEIEGPTKEGKATVEAIVPGSSARLANLGVVNDASEDTGDGIGASGNLTLENVAVEMHEPESVEGITLEEQGSLTMRGGSVTYKSGTKGTAITVGFVPATIEGVTVTIENGAQASGIEGEFGTLTIANTNISLGSTAEAAVESEFADVAASNVTITDSSEESDTAIELMSNATFNGVRVHMAAAKDTEPVVVSTFGGGVLNGLEVSGEWQGPALVAEDTELTLRDSHLSTAPTSASVAVEYLSLSETPGLLIQDSTIQAATHAGPGALEALAGNVTLDSSELLGGQNGVVFEQQAGKTRTLTVAASTIDAGTLGTRDAAPVHGIDVISGGSEVSTADVNVEGSIVLEGQEAIVEAGDSASVACSYSDVPSQTQAASATEGSIACASGADGNDETSALSALFQLPGSNYELNPASVDIDSVPASAIVLPFGLIPSTTDLAGNPRSEGVDCVAYQDKGAFQLQGHSFPCPPPPVAPAPITPKPLPAVITALTIDPSSFFAAPSGATVTAATAKKAKRYGAKVSYRDTQIATTTFTVLRETGGRKQGKSCRKPSKKNAHGKRCTILTAIGSFTHTDVAGANSLHFSGRIKGKALSPGSYRLQAVAHDAAGNGVAVDKGFKIA
ncbi:MAG TPA: hypothetical protein VGY13_02945 [Solirubrobacteraceae bacterium]|nr:hypothetical protein [Solirubrobacteraceae bacterium]